MFMNGKSYESSLSILHEYSVSIEPFVEDTIFLLMYVFVKIRLW